MLPPHLLPSHRPAMILPFDSRRIVLLCILCTVTIPRVLHGQLGLKEPIDFNRDVRPILSENCFHCHGPDAATRQADLRLDEAESATTVVKLDANGISQMLERITSTDSDLRMPPADSHRRLGPQQVAVLQRWVAAGGEYAVHWFIQTPQRPALPDTQAHPWNSTAVDIFVLDALQKEGLTPSPPANPATIARRVSLALTGLPPEPEELNEFLAAVDRWGIEWGYTHWVERLMASPRYGEHMTLPWLEAARYADTDGYQNDRYRYQHAWRDWVIRAFNHNMPYDQFVIEQLAGDMLPNPTLWQQVASGFGRNHRINSEDGSIPEEWHTENVADRIDTVGTVFLGLTVGCARCHDHKYDPISQQEYYQLFAYFNNIAEHGVGPNNGNSPPFVPLPASWPLLSDDEDCAIEPEPVKLRRSREESGNGLKRPQAGSPATVMVMHELLEPRETYLLFRGQYNLPDTSQRLWPSVPQALTFVTSEASQPSNRLEFAQWLVHRDNPLTARVAVNRLWQQLFGTGLVETSENLGSQGTPPSHPVLLDWLAVEFMDSGWNIRHIQRLILLSSTYRQASAVTEELLERDPHNRWLARGPRMRVPAFVIRDQALSTSGLLVETIGGPSVKPYMPADIWSSISNNKYEQDRGQKLFRRSLYTYWRRTIPPPTMMNFNAASREVCSVRTETTNTPLQALTLMNNLSFIEAAKKLAERVMGNSHSQANFWQQRTSQINDAFVRCTARQPTPAESELLLRAFRSLWETYQQNESAATELLALGEAPFDPKHNLADLAAMTMTVSIILNLDETITIE